MDNQQERPRLDPFFVGGLITGEGWFGLTTQKTPGLKMKHGFTIRPRFAIQMNDRATMEALMDTLKAQGIGFYVVDARAKQKSWNDSIRIEIGGMKRVKNFLSSYFDYLYGDKKQSAQVVRDYIELRESKAQADPYGEEEFRLVNMLRFLNGGNKGNKKIVESSETVRRSLS